MGSDPVEEYVNGDGVPEYSGLGGTYPRGEKIPGLLGDEMGLECSVTDNPLPFGGPIFPYPSGWVPGPGLGTMGSDPVEALGNVLMDLGLVSTSTEYHADPSGLGGGR
jgi:hypothetical protein